MIKILLIDWRKIEVGAILFNFPTPFIKAKIITLEQHSSLLITYRKR